MRLLGAARLSNDTDASTSIERQRDAIEGYARAGGHTVVTITEDVDVSGAVSPFERPELGPYLNGKADQWDGICVAKLDRLSRSIVDFGNLLAWCTKHGKVIIVLDPMIDLSTAWGQAMGNVLMTFAQLERQMIGMRVADSRRKSRSNGYWAGGQGIPDGYRPVRVDTHWELEIDPLAAAVITHLALLIIGGSSIRAACKSVNASGYRTAKGREWDCASVSGMLRNQSLRGYVMHDGEPVRGEDGMPVTRDAIIEDDLWATLQTALDKISRRDSGIRHDAAMLLRVLYWGDQPLYMHRRPGKGDRYRTGPKVERSASFSAEVIESMVTDALMATMGTLPMRKLEITPAEDHTTELRKVDEQIGAIEALVTSGDMPPAPAARMLAKLEARRSALSGLESKPEVQRYQETGQTFAEFWDDLGDAERHQFLLDNGVRARVTRDSNPQPGVSDRHVAEVYDDKSKYTVTVEFSHLATLLAAA